MNKYIWIALLITTTIACNRIDVIEEGQSQIKFDQTLWKKAEGDKYPHRFRMVDDVLYGDTLRNMKKPELLKQLGAPSYHRENKDYLYYRIDEKKLGKWTLKTKTLVIKITNKDKVDWIKLHD